MERFVILRQWLAVPIRSLSHRTCFTQLNRFCALLLNKSTTQVLFIYTYIDQGRFLGKYLHILFILKNKQPWGWLRRERKSLPTNIPLSTKLTLEITLSKKLFPSTLLLPPHPSSLSSVAGTVNVVYQSFPNPLDFANHNPLFDSSISPVLEVILHFQSNEINYDFPKPITEVPFPVLDLALDMSTTLASETSNNLKETVSSAAECFPVCMWYLGMGQ